MELKKPTIIFKRKGLIGKFELGKTGLTLKNKSHMIFRSRQRWTLPLQGIKIIPNGHAGMICQDHLSSSSTGLTLKNGGFFNSDIENPTFVFVNDFGSNTKINKGADILYLFFIHDPEIEYIEDYEDKIDPYAIVGSYDAETRKVLEKQRDLRIQAEKEKKMQDITQVHEEKVEEKAKEVKRTPRRIKPVAEDSDPTDQV